MSLKFVNVGNPIFLYNMMPIAKLHYVSLDVKITFVKIEFQ